MWSWSDPESRLREFELAGGESKFRMGFVVLVGVTTARVALVAKLYPSMTA